MNIQELVVDGNKLNVAHRKAAAGSPTLLIFNGIGAGLELLSPFTSALDPAIGIVIFDVPGAGKSSTPVLPYRFRGLSKLAAKVLDQFGIGVVDTLGISWGGALAQQFAHSFPSRCRRLVLVATSHGALSIPPSLKVLRMMASSRRYTDPAYGASIAPDIYGGEFRTNPDLVKKFVFKEKKTNKRGYYHQLFAGMWWSSLPWLSFLRQPTLLLAGNDDPIIPLANMRLMHLLIPKARLEVFDDGHLFLVTDAHRTARLIESFLAKG